MPMPITPPMPAAGAGANMLGNLMGNKPGANVGVVPSPNATAATPAQLPSAAKIAAMFGMPKGTNALDNPGGLAKQTSNAPAAPNVASRNPPTMPVVPYEGTKMGSELEKFARHGKSIMLQREFEAKHQMPNPAAAPVGVGSNFTPGTKVEEKTMVQPKAGEKSAKELTTSAREHISKKNFAEPGKKKYPIEDRSHAANALSRVSQFGSESEKATVRAKVHAKYPDMGKKAALEYFKVSGWGQTIGAAAKAAVPGMIAGGIQGAMDPNSSMLAGAAGGAAMGAGAGALHGHLMQGQGAGAQAYQKGVGAAKQQFGAAKNWMNQQMTPQQPQAPIAPQGFKNAQLREFFDKLATQWSKPQVQQAARQGALQGAWDAAGKTLSGKPMASNTPLTNPNDMGRANALASFMPQGGNFGSPPIQKGWEASGLELDRTPKKFGYGVNKLAKFMRS